MLFLTSEMFESCEENILTKAKSAQNMTHSSTEPLAQSTFNNAFSPIKMFAQMFVGRAKPNKKRGNRCFYEPEFPPLTGTFYGYIGRNEQKNVPDGFVQNTTCKTQCFLKKP